MTEESPDAAAKGKGVEQPPPATAAAHDEPAAAPGPATTVVPTPPPVLEVASKEDQAAEAAGGAGSSGATDGAADDKDDSDDAEDDDERTAGDARAVEASADETDGASSGSESDDEEPKLKYTRLTSYLGGMYRNGDATSAFVVGGDKMIVGTHNGNINVVSLPSFASLRVYHAHSASVTSVSVSPWPPPLPSLKAATEGGSGQGAANWLAAQLGAGGGGVATAAGGGTSTPTRAASASLRSESPRKPPTGSNAAAAAQREPPSIPNTPSNNLYVATSSVDGHVCVQNLVDLRDVQLRNFARPVRAVALSPEYRTDRTYLSGGLAGQLILTVGGAPGLSTSTTTGTAAAVASGWLGSMGLGTNMGRDRVLHQGEGIISTIKWSRSGRFVVWLNEKGIKIMRTRLHPDPAATGEGEATYDDWARIGHVDRPQTDEWEEMAGVWQGQAEWVDETGLEEVEGEAEADGEAGDKVETSPAAERLKAAVAKSDKKIERLLVGWGGTIWIIHVHPGGVGVGKNAGERIAGRAEIVKILRMDCIISGLSLYTQNLLLVLAYVLPDTDSDDEATGAKTQTTFKPGHRSKLSTTSTGSEPAGGIRRRLNNHPPELRLIDLGSQAEVDRDGLSVSRFERLSSADYHLAVLPAPNAAQAVALSKGALETLAGFGSEMWNAAVLNPTKNLFGGVAAVASSAASVRSRGSDEASSRAATTATSSSNTAGVSQKLKARLVHPHMSRPGVKIFIHSPYDCILALRRDHADHLQWLLEHNQYQQAWQLVDEHPEIVSPTSGRKQLDSSSQQPPSTPDRTTAADDFFDDASSAGGSTIRQPRGGVNTAAEREKRRIGELWLQSLVDANQWAAAGEAAGKVLTTSDRWAKWVFEFAGAHKYDEMAPYMPAHAMHPPVPHTAYEVMLAHYMRSDRLRFRELLDRWPVGLFDARQITSALEDLLRFRDVREDSVEDGERGRDWRIVVESLARLHEASGRFREALKYHIRLQDADAAMRLVTEHHLADAVADDIPGFVALRVPAEREKDMSVEELEEATAEAVAVLVDEAQHGLVKPDLVVGQLTKRGMMLYVFFYLRSLWKGEGVEHEHQTRETKDRLAWESKSLLSDYADVAVHLFAKYDRPLLMDFLRRSTAYAFEKAAQECEQFNYIPELVYLYSKTGQTKRALYLIIDRLGDVSRAIAFAKEQDDPELWSDLLDYSMDKPMFIRGLLEEVGTAIDPITLVRRIPEGLEIDGLRDGLQHIMKEHEIQHSISSGVARVLRSEVAAHQAALRAGRSKGIKFEVVPKGRDEAAAVGPGAPDHVDVQSAAVPTNVAGSAAPGVANGEGGPPDRRGKQRATAAATTNGTATPTDISDDFAIAPLTNGHGQRHDQPGHFHSEPQPGHCAYCRKAFSASPDGDDSTEDTLVGFACGHVFHLRHLLQMLHPGEDADADADPDGAGGDADVDGRGGGAGKGVYDDYYYNGGERREGGGGGRYSVGTKVTHARILRDKISGGCPVCKERKGAGEL